MSTRVNVMIAALALIGLTGCNKDDGKGAGSGQPSGGTTGGAAKPKADDSAFGVASAKIVFKITGRQEGTMTAWFVESGATVALFNDMTNPAEKRHIVWKNKETMGWKEGEKPFTSKFRSKDSELRLISTNDPKQLEMGGYKKQPNAAIAGQDCEVWNKDKVTIWRWKGIDLKYENGADVYEATEVVTPSEIPPEMLAPK